MFLAFIVAVNVYIRIVEGIEAAAISKEENLGLLDLLYLFSLYSEL